MKPLICIVVLMILVYSTWFFSVQLGSFNVSNYRGDGQIKTIGGGFLGKGVELTLPIKSIERKEFSLTKLPITRRDYVFFTNAYADSDSDISLQVKVIDKNGEIIRIFEINKKNSIDTSFEDSAKFYYTIDGYIPKEKVGNVDKMIISSVNGANKTNFKIILRSGGSI